MTVTIAKPEFFLTLNGQRLRLCAWPWAVFAVEKLTGVGAGKLAVRWLAGELSTVEICTIIWAGVAAATPSGRPQPTFDEIGEAVLRHGAYQRDVLAAVEKFLTIAVSPLPDPADPTPTPAADQAATPEPKPKSKLKSQPQPPPEATGPTLH